MEPKSPRRRPLCMSLPLTLVTIIDTVEPESVLLGKRITAVRQQRGWSRSDLARKAGVDPSYITRIEEGDYKRPSIDRVKALADALRVPMSALTEPPPDPDDDALLRRLIEKRIGSDNAPIVELLIEQLRDRPAIDQRAMLGVILASVQLLHPNTAR